jgi:hypothetical protein
MCAAAWGCPDSSLSVHTFVLTPAPPHKCFTSPPPPRTHNTHMQGDGVPPTEAREFCDWLTGGKAGQLPGLSYAVCALGDTSYTHFCKCGKTLDAALAAAGAAPLTGKGDWGAGGVPGGVAHQAGNRGGGGYALVFV